MGHRLGAATTVRYPGGRGPNELRQLAGHPRGAQLSARCRAGHRCVQLVGSGRGLALQCVSRPVRFPGGSPLLPLGCHPRHGGSAAAAGWREATFHARARPSRAPGTTSLGLQEPPIVVLSGQVIFDNDDAPAFPVATTVLQVCSSHACAARTALPPWARPRSPAASHRWLDSR